MSDCVTLGGTYEFYEKRNKGISDFCFQNDLKKVEELKAKGRYAVKTVSREEWRYMIFSDKKDAVKEFILNVYCAGYCPHSSEDSYYDYLYEDGELLVSAADGVVTSGSETLKKLSEECTK